MKTAIKSVQQFMLGTVLNNEQQARYTLERVKAAGYDGIELCDFMIRPTGLIVRMLTRAAGMPVGKGGKLNWHALVKEAGLQVISLHTDLGSLERDASAVITQAKSYGTNTIVITGMYRFDFGSEAEVSSLAQRLNKIGSVLALEGMPLLYHNHNCELRKVNERQTAYDLLCAETNPEYVNFEFDSYWFCEGGADALAAMKSLGSRMKLWHVNDRGSRITGKSMTPILKTESMELGSGSMELAKMADVARRNDVSAVVLESHRNWVDKSPVKSLEMSAKFLHENF